MTLKLDIDPRALAYRVVIRPDQYADGSIAYIAEIPELPGCKSHGRTPEEASVNVEDAKREYLEALMAEGLEIPTPKFDQGPGYVWQIVASGSPDTASASTVTQEFPGLTIQQASVTCP